MGKWTSDVYIASAVSHSSRMGKPQQQNGKTIFQFFIYCLLFLILLFSVWYFSLSHLPYFYKSSSALPISTSPLARRDARFYNNKTKKIKKCAILYYGIVGKLQSSEKLRDQDPFEKHYETFLTSYANIVNQIIEPNEMRYGIQFDIHAHTWSTGFTEDDLRLFLDAKTARIENESAVFQEIFGNAIAHRESSEDKNRSPVVAAHRKFSMGNLGMFVAIERLLKQVKQYCFLSTNNTLHDCYDFYIILRYDTRFLQTWNLLHLNTSLFYVANWCMAPTADSRQYATYLIDEYQTPLLKHGLFPEKEQDVRRLFPRTMGRQRVCANLREKNLERKGMLPGPGLPDFYFAGSPRTMSSVFVGFATSFFTHRCIPGENIVAVQHNLLIGRMRCLGKRAPRIGRYLFHSMDVVITRDLYSDRAFPCWEKHRLRWFPQPGPMLEDGTVVAYNVQSSYNFDDKILPPGSKRWQPNNSKESLDKLEDWEAGENDSYVPGLYASHCDGSIERRIFQLWIGEKPTPFLWTNTWVEWARTNGVQYSLYNEQQALAVIDTIVWPNVRAELSTLLRRVKSDQFKEKLGHAAFVDILRLGVLYAHGGVYIDADIVPNPSMTADELFGGCARMPRTASLVRAASTLSSAAFDGSLCAARVHSNDYVSTIDSSFFVGFEPRASELIANSVVAAKKGHPLLVSVWKTISNELLERMRRFSNTYEYTGPAVMTSLMHAYVLYTLEEFERTFPDASSQCSKLDVMHRLRTAQKNNYEAVTLDLSLSPPTVEIQELFAEAMSDESFRHVCVLPRHRFFPVEWWDAKGQYDSYPLTVPANFDWGFDGVRKALTYQFGYSTRYYSGEVDFDAVRHVKDLPLVSIMIPTVSDAPGRLDALQLALRNIVAQDYPHERMEVVIIDSATTCNARRDGTERLIREALSGVPYQYACARRTDPTSTGPTSTKRVAKGNSAVTLATVPLGKVRNMALQLAKGSIVMHADDDDAFSPVRVRLQVRDFVSDLGLTMNCLPFVNVYLAHENKFLQVKSGVTPKCHPGTIAYVHPRVLNAQGNVRTPIKFNDTLLQDEDVEFMKLFFLSNNLAVETLEERNLYVYVRTGLNTARCVENCFAEFIVVDASAVVPYWFDSTVYEKVWANVASLREKSTEVQGCDCKQQKLGAVDWSASTSDDKQKIGVSKEGSDVGDGAGNAVDVELAEFKNRAGRVPLHGRAGKRWVAQYGGPGRATTNSDEDSNASVQNNGDLPQEVFIGGGIGIIVILLLVLLFVMMRRKSKPQRQISFRHSHSGRSSKRLSRRLSGKVNAGMVAAGGNYTSVPSEGVYLPASPQVAPQGVQGTYSLESAAGESYGTLSMVNDETGSQYINATGIHARPYDRPLGQ